MTWNKFGRSPFLDHFNAMPVIPFARGLSGRNNLSLKLNNICLNLSGFVWVCHTETVLFCNGTGQTCMICTIDLSQEAGISCRPFISAVDLLGYLGDSASIMFIISIVKYWCSLEQNPIFCLHICCRSVVRYKFGKCFENDLCSLHGCERNICS